MEVGCKGRGYLPAEYLLFDYQAAKDYLIQSGLIEKFERKRFLYYSKDLSVISMNHALFSQLVDRALTIIPERVAYYAKIVGVDYGHITIRNQRTRWGSCSSKGNLNFNCLLMLTPTDILDYVVVHELCHRKEMNHSKAFWSEVEKVLPNYKESVRWLKEEGSRIMLRQK